MRAGQKWFRLLVCAGTILSPPPLPLIVRRGRLLWGRRWRHGCRGRIGDHDRLTNLQFSIIFDVVEALQFFDTDLVLLGDGGESFAPSNGVRVPGGARRFCRRGAGRSRCWFSDQHAWFRHLLLKLENLLRKRVDLGVLLIQLFADRFQLRGIRFLVRRLRPRQGREKYGRRRYRQDFHRSHVDIWL